MCCTLEEAILSSTVLLAHEVEHEGRMVNIIGYQNHAESRGVGPNAMIIPIPSATPMSQANCVDMTGAGSVFKDYWDILRPRTRGMSKGVAVAGGLDDSLEVFDSGSYTVLLTKQVGLTDLREAMAKLPPDKRIELDLQKAKIFSAYRKFYPDWHIAICIWNGEVKAEPILWWYDPMPEYVGSHFLPGLDAHDGSPPRFDGAVAVDHTIVVGAPSERPGWSNADKIVGRAPPHLRKWLPSHVFGEEIGGQLRNGDWVLPKDGWSGTNSFDRVVTAPRVVPPGVQG